MENTPVLKSNSLSTASRGTARVAPAEQELAGSVADRTERRGSLAGVGSRLLGSVSTWGFVDQGIVSVASFAAAAIVGRVCGQAELGIYSLAVSIFWLVAGIPNALVWMPYTARAPRMNQPRRRFYLGSVTAHLVLLAAVLALLLLVVGFLPIPGLAESDWFLPMCAALVPFSLLMMLREHLRRVLLADMNTKALLQVDVPIAICQLAILARLAWSQRLTAISALVGMAIACGWGVVWVVLNRQRFRLKRNRVELHWKSNFQFGKWLVVVSIAWLLGDAAYRWLVGSMHGLAVLGQYAAAVTTVMFLNPIMLTIQNLARSILSNELARGGCEQLWGKTLQGTQLIAAGFGVLFLALAVFGGNLVTLFFSDQFSGLGVVVASLCL
ncbi:MAG: lipopolysaccharide biosynthesis protein [Bythopirellula sp.]